MSVTIYHNPKCSKSRDALRLIEGRGITPEIVDYQKTPPSPAVFRRILALLGKSARDVLRRKEAALAGIDPDLPEDQLIAAMLAHPAVIERPIVVAGAKARIGRPPDVVLEIL